EADASFALHGLDARGASRFAIPLPARGHAAAAHPLRPEAVAFARRPGRFALIVDCAEGRETVRLTPPPGRVFCGHGAFSADGGRLFTTENAFDDGDGRLGIWDASAGYRRIGEVPTQGIGPHEVVLSPDGGSLVVANGGILTHPDSGRAKLNLATLRPNLVRLAVEDGALLGQVEPAARLRRNSLRHLAIAADGAVLCAAQWEGDLRAAPPLLALWRPGAEALKWRVAPDPWQARLRGYAGSIAVDRSGEAAALTAPRGGLALIFAGPDLSFDRAVLRPDVCGVAAGGDGFVFTDGGGGVLRAWAGSERSIETSAASAGRAWDNHLVSLSA
ncbi:MAG: DUF1513 domain-containing protein, partial [Pseudomonadota bacterium]